MAEYSYSFATQSIGLSTVINARELGGYVLPGGGVVRKGVLIRGGALVKVSPEELDRLKNEFHISLIFDFRTSMEVKHAPDMHLDGARNIWLPAFDENRMTMEKLSLPEIAYRNLGCWLIENARNPEVQKVAMDMYSVMVENEFTQVQYAGFFQNILSSENDAVYWHCSQGKDRTGIGAAFILAALGADRSLIMHDFDISNEVYREDVKVACSKVNTEGEREAIRTFIGVNPRYFAAALDLIDEKYGSMDNYLKGPLCLSDGDIEALRDKYLQ